MGTKTQKQRKCCYHNLNAKQLIEERDFQAKYGLASDVDRLRGGLRVVVLAVRAAQKHPDPENLNLLAEAVAMLGDLPELPTRNSFDRLVPENFDLDEDDEVMLDPDEIERPLQSENAMDFDGRFERV